MQGGGQPKGEPRSVSRKKETTFRHFSVTGSMIPVHCNTYLTPDRAAARFILLGFCIGPTPRGATVRVPLRELLTY
jgi:hypothetical protein